MAASTSGDDPLVSARHLVVVGALVANLLLVSAMVLAIAVLAPDLWGYVVIAGLAIFMGWCVGIVQRRGDGKRHAEHEARVGRALDRLCLQADLPRPGVRVPGGLPPLSWTSQVPFRRPKVVVTEAMAERLDDDQLEAAVAHELGHIASGDAWLMTLAAGPPAAQLAGVRHVWEHDELRAKLATIVFFAWTIPPSLLLMGVARIASRNRELDADRMAAALTGSPATLAATLTTLTDELTRSRDRDLRTLATADVFHLLPAHEPTGLGRLWATHPPLARRLAELDALERRLQGEADGA